MRKVMGWGLSGMMAATLLGGAAPAAFANDGDVIATGPCSAGSTWKLKNSPENGQLEVEFEVDQNVVGDTWRVVIRYNGERIFRGRRVTEAPSGSFEVERRVANQAGPDTVQARAENTRTGEICRGTVTSDF